MENNIKNLSLESYAVNKLMELEERNKELENEVNTLKAEKVGQDIGVRTEALKINESPKYYYYKSCDSAYCYNRILKKNNKTPEFLEEALTNEETLEEFMTLKEGYNKVCEKTKELYDYLVCCRNGARVILKMYNEDVSYYKVGERMDSNIFIDEELRDRLAKEEVIENIKDYLRKYKDQFEKTE